MSTQSNPVEVTLPASHYDRFTSIAAKSRKPSPIRALYPLESRPNMISLLAGKPNPSTFPFTSMSFTATNPLSPSSAPTPFEVDTGLLAESLQYGATAGLPAFVKWLGELQEGEHGRKREDGWRVSVGTGSQDLISKAMISIFDPEDAILIESPVYTNILTVIDSIPLTKIEVPTDGDGLIPSRLQSILENWPQDKPMPKALYTIPYGGNPAGTTVTLERRKEVLRLSRKYDFIILEDDPYYYLYFGEPPRPASYFSLEATEQGPGIDGRVGRVLRFDSFSKVLAAGMRIGFVTGPSPLVDRIDQHSQSANLQSAHLTQAIALTLLSSWGPEGFKAHTHSVSALYKEKRDMFERALRKYLGDEGLAEWSTPCAGMFVWFRLILSDPQQGQGQEAAVEDSSDLIRTRAVQEGIIALPGTVFIPNGGPTPYVRASFSLLDEETTEEAMRRLRRVVLRARGREEEE